MYYVKLDSDCIIVYLIHYLSSDRFALIFQHSKY